MTRKPRVGILVGSESDWKVLEAAAQVLRDFDVPYECGVLSAHRTPHEVAEYATTAHDRGLRVLVCGAGKAAHLAGVVAAHTALPVIGVPVPAAELQGMDALLATVQMPAGVPVATVAIGGAKNAGLLAIQILGTADPRLYQAFVEYKRVLAESARRKTLPDPGLR